MLLLQSELFWCSFLEDFRKKCRNFPSAFEQGTKKWEAHNEKCFKAGEVLWDYGTIINILLKTTQKKAPQGKMWKFFLLDTFKTKFWMENLIKK